MSNIDKLKKLYNFEFEEIKTGSFEEVSKKYLAAYKDGKEEGYTPIFLTVDDYLLKTFKITMANENTDNMLDIFNKNLEKAKNINPIELFNKFIEQSMDKYFTEDDYKFDDNDKNNLKLLTIFNHEGNLKDNVILVKIPTAKSYEILAYFGMGSEGIATVKYWYEKYGAVPAAITYDEIEFYVERPVLTFEEAKKLAIEQYAFCYGLLWECYDTLDELASAIYKNVHWYFWWS